MSLAETAAALSQPTEQRQGWEAEGGRGNARGGGPAPSSTVSLAMNSPICPFLIQIHPECEVIHVRLEVVGSQVVFSVQI